MIKRTLKDRKFVLLYGLYLIGLLVIILLAYKVYERKIKYRFNDLACEIKYLFAIKKADTTEKKDWLRKWKTAAPSWDRLNYMVHVPYLMFQYTPNIRSPGLNTNDMGFRGYENYSQNPSVKPDPGYRYVILLGGSSAFGAFSTSDEFCISAQLERMLNQAFKNGRPFKVVNLSMGFYNSFQEVMAYILYGLKFNPVAVITFDGFNDASVASDSHGGRKVPMISGNYYHTKDVLEKVNQLSLKTTKKDYFLTKPDVYTAWDKESVDFTNDVAELYRRNLELICILSKESHTKVILSLQPVQVLENGRMAWRDHRLELEAIYRLFPEKIKSVAKAYGANFIDFQEIFSQNKEYNDYFSHTDAVHLIDKGQEIVALQMMDKLRYVLADE